MSLTPGNPTVGGTTLRLPAIQSPNYVPGTSGWIIRQDGTAEFAGLIIDGGTVVIGSAGSVFLYSGVPAAGNLVISLASVAGTDAFGNSYPTGFNVQGTNGTKITAWLQAVTGSAILLFTPQDNTMAAGNITGTSSGGVGTLGLFPPHPTGLSSSGSIQLTGGTSGHGTISLTAPDGITASGDLLSLNSAIVDTTIPAPVQAFVNNTIAVTSTNVYASLPAPGPLTATIANPSLTRALQVEVTYQAWMQANGAATRAGVAASGSNTFTPVPGTGGSVAFGQTLYMANQGGTATAKLTGQIVVSIPAGGTTTFELQAFRETGGTTNAVNYPVLTALPVRFT